MRRTPRVKVLATTKAESTGVRIEEPRGGAGGRGLGDQSAFGMLEELR